MKYLIFFLFLFSVNLIAQDDDSEEFYPEDYDPRSIEFFGFGLAFSKGTGFDRNIFNTPDNIDLGSLYWGSIMLAAEKDNISVDVFATITGFEQKVSSYWNEDNNYTIGMIEYGAKIKWFFSNNIMQPYLSLSIAGLYGTVQNTKYEEDHTIFRGGMIGGGPGINFNITDFLRVYVEGHASLGLGFYDYKPFPNSTGLFINPSTIKFTSGIYFILPNWI